MSSSIVTTELVAKTIKGIPQIGYALTALQDAGWDAKIVVNRIVVAGEIEARLCLSEGGGWWTIFAVDRTPPVWTVSATEDEEANSWVGCVG